MSCVVSLSPTVSARLHDHVPIRYGSQVKSSNMSKHILLLCEVILYTDATTFYRH